MVFSTDLLLAVPSLTCSSMIKLPADNGKTVAFDRDRDWNIIAFPDLTFH